VLDGSGSPAANISVYAFTSNTYTNYSGKTTASGQIILTLPQGSYRFRADSASVQYWSSVTNACTLPGCESAQVVLSTTPLPTATRTLVPTITLVSTTTPVSTVTLMGRSISLMVRQCHKWGQLTKRKKSYAKE